MHIFVVSVVIVILVVVVTVGVVVLVVVLDTYLFSLSFLPSYFLVCAEWCTLTRSFYFLERVHRAFFVCGERYLLLQFFPQKIQQKKQNTQKKKQTHESASTEELIFTARVPATRKDIIIIS